MKIRSFIAAVGAAAVVGTGAFALPALASPHATTHTLKFIAVAKKAVKFTKTEFGGQETDVNSKGRIVGFDMVYEKSITATTVAGNITVDTRGGMLYGTFRGNLKTGVASHGKVTGGTGGFKGATGTVKAKAVGSHKTAVTITYRT
jgi:hypothetical protein